MKAINAIIIVLVAALGFSAYLLVSKIMPKSDPASTASAPHAAPSPEPAAMPQPRNQINSPAAPAPAPQPSVTRHEQPPVQTQPAPAPQIKEEPKLRPARDIKVVMYMTDW